jgi:hypothetical protein
MSTKAKIPIPAGRVSGFSIDYANQNVLTAVAGGGVRGTEGRPVYLVMTDAEVRGILARLSLDSRWSAALDVLAATAFPIGPQAPDAERERYRRHLCERMAEAMAEACRVQP